MHGRELKRLYITTTTARINGINTAFSSVPFVRSSDLDDPLIANCLSDALCRNMWPEAKVPEPEQSSVSGREANTHFQVLTRMSDAKYTIVSTTTETVPATKPGQLKAASSSSFILISR